MLSAFAKVQGKTLIYKNKEYIIRYMTSQNVVCNTDELFGKFGDEFPINLVK